MVYDQVQGTYRLPVGRSWGRPHYCPNDGGVRRCAIRVGPVLRDSCKASSRANVFAMVNRDVVTGSVARFSHPPRQVM